VRAFGDSCYMCVVTGEIGSATKMKLMVSLMGCSMLANLAESLALAEKLSLDQEELLKVIDLSWMSCQLIRTQGSGTCHSSCLRCEVLVQLGR
jgi:3-hydroxyisobutyrate dehydrogenase-like beta-hydroxyacid dehydrogenase